MTRVILFSTLRPIDQHFFIRRLVVRDALERDVRDDAADFLALLVLLALVDEAARRPALLVFQFVVGKRRGQQALPRERERHAAGVDRDPAPAPLLGDVGRRPAAAGRVEDEVAGVGGHEEAALNDLRIGLNHVESCLSMPPAQCPSQTLLNGRNRKVFIRNACRVVFPVASRRFGQLAEPLHALQYWSSNACVFAGTKCHPLPLQRSERRSFAGLLETADVASATIRACSGRGCQSQILRTHSRVECPVRQFDIVVYS